jgi:hypothetical protein
MSIINLGQKYDRSAFGMKIMDADNFCNCIKRARRLVYLALPCNLIDKDVSKLNDLYLQQI